MKPIAATIVTDFADFLICRSCFITAALYVALYLPRKSSNVTEICPDLTFA